MSLSLQEKRQRTADAYAHFFDSLQAERLHELGGLVSEQVHFVDPFNDVKGRDQLERVFAKMFEDVEQPEFTILDVMWSSDLCFLRWDFTCRQKWLGDWRIRGMSELHFDDDGRISAHYDYWDSGRAFYAKLPVIGPMVRFLMRRISV